MCRVDRTSTLSLESSGVLLTAVIVHLWCIRRLRILCSRTCRCSSFRISPWVITIRQVEYGILSPPSFHEKPTWLGPALLVLAWFGRRRHDQSVRDRHSGDRAAHDPAPDRRPGLG